MTAHDRSRPSATTAKPFHPPERTPEDARSVARLQLTDLHRRLGQRLTPPHSFDAYTLAHLTESRARIEKALQAGLELKK